MRYGLSRYAVRFDLVSVKVKNFKHYIHLLTVYDHFSPVLESKPLTTRGIENLQFW